MMGGYSTEELRGLFARLEDLAGRSAQGMLGVTDFLSPREAYYGADYLRRQGLAPILFGGYEGAERCKLYLLPDYLAGFGDPEADFPAFLEQLELDSELTALRVEGSGYRRLTHRDFLGSLLALGLERSVLGDILIEGEEGRSAVLFCNRVIAPFLLAELKQVANDKVRLYEVALSSLVIPPRRFALIHDTVASPRLDAVVAALCGLSRERAREAVCGGLVELNFACEERPDRAVEAPALLSVRGVGRFRVLSLSEQTKKGRLRLAAEKYL